MNNPPDLEGLLRTLIKLPRETGWVEFKKNNADPDMIGKLISGLSNSAALDDKTNAYLIWGVEDGTHAITGTSFIPSISKKGNEDLENWLARLLSPRLHLHFYTITADGLPIVILEIPSAHDKPTAFSGIEYVRTGSANHPLKEHTQKEKALWRIFDHTPFENRCATTNVTAGEALELIDYPAYFQLLKLQLPSDRAGIISKLEEDRLLIKNGTDQIDITNLGAILFARNLQQFPTLARKAVRLVVYEGRNRVKTLREQPGQKGYASGFNGLIGYMNVLLPRNEVIGKALREEIPMYPDMAVRELIANALIHQDFSITGTGPIIEIFEDRIEITNPGVTLIDVSRLLDHSPRSRNEALASFMRRINICEERGSGIDKVVFQTEFYQLPPPRWLQETGALRVILFAYKELKNMDRSDKVHACYLHACLQQVQHDQMTNTSLRERFGIETQNAAIASRIINDALQDGLIKPFEVGQSKRTSRYLPFWA